MLLQNLPGSVQQYIYIKTASVYQNSLRLPMKKDAPKPTGPPPGPGGDYAYKKLLLESEFKEFCGGRELPMSPYALPLYMGNPG